MKRSSFGLRAVLFAAAAAALVAATVVAASTPQPVDISTFASAALDWAMQPPAEGTAGLAMIVPTVGRKVWYRPSAYDQAGPGGMQCWGTPQQQPIDATVIGVNSERSVNLFCVDNGGRTHVRMSVKLLQDDDAPPVDGNGKVIGGYAEWMPYQKEQAGSPIHPSNTVKPGDPQPATPRTADANTA